MQPLITWSSESSVKGIDHNSDELLVERCAVKPRAESVLEGTQQVQRRWPNLEATAHAGIAEATRAIACWISYDDLSSEGGW